MNILHTYKNEFNYNDPIIWAILFIILHKRSIKKKLIWSKLIKYIEKVIKVQNIVNVKYHNNFSNYF
jgi:hypothetical protein